MEALCTVLGDAEPTLTVFRCGQNDCRFDTVVQLRRWHDLRFSLGFSLVESNISRTWGPG